MNDIKKPKPQSSLAERELDKCEQQFKEFDDNIKSLTHDRMNQAPLLEHEPQTKLSQNEIAEKKDVYLKPVKTIASRDKFNEKFREEYNFQREYVQFIYEHKECIGDTLDIWTRPFGGMPAEEWLVPANTPVWGPRYLAEQIAGRVYHRLVMKNETTGVDGHGTYYGQLAADSTIARMTATPVTKRKSIFMGSNNF